MASVSKPAVDVWAAGRVDLDRVKATKEAEIEAYMIEEGENPADPLAGYTILNDPMEGVKAAKSGTTRASDGRFRGTTGRGRKGPRIEPKIA